MTLKLTIVKHIENQDEYVFIQIITATWFSAEMSNEVGFALPL